MWNIEGDLWLDGESPDTDSMSLSAAMVRWVSKIKEFLNSFLCIFRPAVPYMMLSQ